MSGDVNVTLDNKGKAKSETVKKINKVVTVYYRAVTANSGGTLGQNVFGRVEGVWNSSLERGGVWGPPSKKSAKHNP